MISAIEALPSSAKVAAVVGVPSVIAMYLVWFLSVGVGANAAAAATASQHVSAQVDKMMDTQTKLLRILCVQIAKGDADLVQRCLAVE